MTWNFNLLVFIGCDQLDDTKPEFCVRAATATIYPVSAARALLVYVLEPESICVFSPLPTVNYKDIN